MLFNRETGRQAVWDANALGLRFLNANGIVFEQLLRNRGHLTPVPTGLRWYVFAPDFTPLTELDTSNFSNFGVYGSALSSDGSLLFGSAGDPGARIWPGW